MANASVDKMKELGLRHGEKAVMAVATALCLTLLFMAVSQRTIQTTPEQVRKAADAADSNLKRPQNPEDILKKLEESGITDPHFETVVDNQSKNRLEPAAYAVRSPWITIEPGAGLIRDMPELIAPADLMAYPGRGSTLVFELDANGERIPDPNKDVKDEPANKRRARRRAPAMGMMGMGGTGAARKKGRGNPAQLAAEDKRKYEEEQKKLKRQLAGNVEEGEEAKGKKEEAATEGAPTVPSKEIVRGLRWVAITGVLDYKKLRDNYTKALKNSAIAYPHFKQLDVERQVLQSDGEWSPWEATDSERNWAIVNNLPEEEDELTPESVRLNALVDPLPFLKAGYWERVHVASLVPKEKREIAKPASAEGMMGSNPMAGGGMSQMQMQMQQMQSGGGGMGGNQDMMRRMTGGGNMMAGMMGGMSGGSSETIDYQKTDADKVMIRSLDFTVDPDQTYRFRVRIVVFNPNRGRQDVSPGVDTKSIDLSGPWSEPTNEVMMPADVAAYAMEKVRDAGTRSGEVKFQVTCWNPTDGVTVVKTFDAGPGDIVGTYATASIPTSEGTGKKSKPVDFTSRQVVLDTAGGDQALPKDLGTVGRLDAPALSLLMRPDGSVVVRNEANDYQDDVRKTIESNYKRELEESNKKRENSMGSASGSNNMMMMMMGGGSRR